MKSKILKLSTMPLILLIIGVSCQKDEDDKIKYDDENISISSIPGINIYKTKSDHFNYISVQELLDGQVNDIPSYTLGDPRVKRNDIGQTVINTRWLLKSGFIVDKETYLNDVFTDISIHEYVNYNAINNVAGWPGGLIAPRIIDRDPFTIFYHLDGVNKAEKILTLGEINNMIENGTIEEHFTKEK